jgi:hypothetical protein
MTAAPFLAMALLSFQTLTCLSRHSAPPSETKRTIAGKSLCRKDKSMTIQHGSVHFQILDRLCAMPKAVRGVSAPMLQRMFGNFEAVEDLVSAGLIRKRGWADGPGSILVPTPEGEALLDQLKAPHRSPLVTSGDRVILPEE